MTASDTARCPNCFGAAAVTPCPDCGWEPGFDNPPPALSLGQILDGRYRIGRVLGHGGFGITYLAWDENLQLRLAIKEYLPRDSASRAPDGVSLAVYSGRAGEQFAYGLERFLEEARALAHFVQHPGIVTVTNFFRAHGTGYCVMDYVEGVTLGHYLEQQPGGRISVDAALKLLTPAMDALRAVHQEGLLHRDISPDNIYISRDGRIRLLDFGAARFAAGEHSKSLSVILKPGYSPEEQYRTKGSQGPWTDVYGLGATFYRAITGQLPPDSLDRLEVDDLISPSALGVEIRPEQETVLLKALVVRAAQRYPSITEFQKAWSTAEFRASNRATEQAPRASPAAALSQPLGDERKRKSAPVLAYAALAVILLAAGFLLFSRPTPETATQVHSSPPQGGTATAPGGIPAAATPATPATPAADAAVSSLAESHDAGAPSVDTSLAPPGDTDAEPSMWQADWGNGIRATAQTIPCADSQLRDQGYQYELSVDIPINRLQNPGDAWDVRGDRAKTVQGCWFKKDDGLAHAKMIRKKDRKTWEQDLNFRDGSWRSSSGPGEEIALRPAPSKFPIYFAAELAPTGDDIPPEAPLCYRFMVSGLEEQLSKLQTKYPSLYDEDISTKRDGAKILVAKRKDDNGREISYFYSTSPTACTAFQTHHLRATANRIPDMQFNVSGGESFYLSDRLKDPVYLRSLKRAISGKRAIPPWLAGYIRREYSGVEGTGRAIFVAGSAFDAYATCQSHACLANSIKVAFTKDGSKAWICYKNDEGAKLFYGSPNAEMQYALCEILRD